MINTLKKFLVLILIFAFSSLSEPIHPTAGGLNLGRTFTKLEHEKRITIGFLGGSITAGDGASDPNSTSYAALVTRWFITQFPGAAIKSINAGVGGTGSEYGAFRVYHDLRKADLVFIEFAANDQHITDRETVLKYTEGILRRLYLANPQVEIVILDVPTETSITNDIAGKITPTLQWHQEIANHYSLNGLNSVLYVNSGTDMAGLVSAGQATWSGGSNPLTVDGIHPNDTGHRLIAGKVITALQQARAAYTKLPPFTNLPAPLYPTPLQNGQLIDTIKAAASAGWDYQKVSKYQQAFATSLEANSVGATLDFTFSGSSYIGISLLQTVPGGSFEAWIDNNEAKSFSTKGPFVRQDFERISENLSPGTHTLHVRVTALPVIFLSFMINP